MTTRPALPRTPAADARPRSTSALHRVTAWSLGRLRTASSCRSAVVLPVALAAQVALPAAANAQDRLWIGRLGNDTALVEAVRVEGRTLHGSIINVAVGLNLQRYEVDLDEVGRVRTVRSWNVDDLSAPLDGVAPSLSIEIGEDSIRTTSTGPNGTRTSAVASADGVVPIFDPFFNNPLALMDHALTRARAEGEGTVSLYYAGRSAVTVAALEDAGAGSVTFPYVMAQDYPMLADARLRAEVTAVGMQRFDASETTFKIVSEPAAWVDPATLLERFRGRGLEEAGFGAMSPPASASGSVGGIDVRVTYGQPRRRGRRIFPDVVPFGEVWRAGANAATQVTFGGDVRVAGSPVPAGSYSLWVLPGERSDTLILNRAARVWGVSYDPASDLVRLPMEREMPGAPVEALLFEIAERDGRTWLSLAWDDRRMSVPLEPGGVRR